MHVKYKKTYKICLSITRRHSYKIHLAKIQQNILETDLLNLSNPEKSVVSACKLFHMLTIRMLKKLRIVEGNSQSSMHLVESATPSGCSSISKNFTNRNFYYCLQNQYH